VFDRLAPKDAQSQMNAIVLILFTAQPLPFVAVAEDVKGCPIRQPEHRVPAPAAPKRHPRIAVVLREFRGRHVPRPEIPPRTACLFRMTGRSER
jgi:hypothetical protein